MEADRRRQALSAAIARVAAGEAEALETVYRLTSAKLFGVCLRILGDGVEAEDVLQEIYLNVWRNAAAFDAGRASPISWLAAIARNRAIDALRRRRPERARPLEEAAEAADPAPSAVAVMEGDEAAARLRSCLEALEARQQAAVRAAFFEGRTYEALAREADVPAGTMKSWIRRALIKLKVCLAS